MYRFSEIKDLHLEISSRCQASCPMCARNFHGGLPNPLLAEKDWSLELTKKILDNEILSQISSITMCGNYGDPILNKDLIPIVEYIVSQNEKINIGIHTNGGARSKSWWKELAEALPENHTVHFALDGLEDTHHLYRVGTDFNKIIENAKEFIAAGGNARWVFITFKHNEHQIDDARNLARELGFKSFYEKQTSRFIAQPYFEVLDKNSNVTHRLEMPGENKLIFIDKTTVENYREIFKDVKIDCAVKKTKSVYVDAFGFLWPCCFVGAVPYIYTRTDQLVHHFQEDSRETFFKTVEKFGGMDNLNLRNRSIKEIIESKEWQSVWEQNFQDNSLRVCTRTCGKFPQATISQSQDQFLNLEVFDE